MKIQDIKVHVVGVTFKNDNGMPRQQILEGVTNGDKLILERERNNKYDINAIMVKTVEGEQIGYIGKDYAQVIAPIMDSGRGFTAVVEDTGSHRFKGKGKPVRYCAIRIDEE